jgi:hypothetical protein
MIKGLLFSMLSRIGLCIGLKICFFKLIGLLGWLV